ncbi:MAG: LysE family transporter [Anaerolineae bacterium]
MYVYFFQAVTLGFSAAVSPGAFQAYLLSHTLQHGLRRTLPTVLAPLITDGPIILIVLLVLTQAPAWLLRALQIAGGVFLIYLAKGAFDAFRKYQDKAAAPEYSASQSVLKAVLTNALSPGPWLFWTVLAGPIVIKAWEQSPWQAASFIVGFYAAMLGTLTALVVVFAGAGRLDPHVTRGLNGVAAVALLLLGVYQLYTGIFAPGAS